MTARPRPRRDRSPAARETAVPATGDDGLATQRLRLWLQMLKATRLVEGRLRERLRTEFDTTLPRFDVLAALHGAPDGMKMSALSSHLVVSNGNVTGVVNTLVEDGLLERENLESDRRAYVVRITPDGRRLMDEMVQAHLGWVDELFASASEADVHRAIALMIGIRNRA